MFSDCDVAPEFSKFVLACGRCVEWIMRGIFRTAPLGIGVVLALLLLFFSRCLDVSM